MIDFDKTLICVSAFLLFLVFGCSSMREHTCCPEADLPDAAIRIAIEDFSNHCSLFRKDSTFHVRFNDKVHHKSTLYSSPDEHGRPIWRNAEGEVIEGLVSVGIAGFGGPYFYGESTKDRLPSRYIIVNDKLFYWEDADCPMTEETFNVFMKYGLLETDEDAWWANLSVGCDDKKVAHYYFKKNDLSKFKRVLSTLAIGEYEPPKLR